MDAHHELQKLPGVVGYAMHLTTFSNAKLWPVYIYFGNESKYCHCKPTYNLSNHVAYFQKLQDLFKDFAGTYTKGKGVGHECITHCQHGLFQAQWRVLLNHEFLEAYEHRIMIMCCDGVKHRFYLWVFTYSTDYPENHIYKRNYGIDSTVVELLLKPDSWVPNSKTLSDSLGLLGFNVFAALVIDLLHKFELGVWCTGRFPHLGQQLLGGFLSTLLKYPTWLHTTSKIFYRSLYTNLYKCSILVFEGLLPNAHNKILLNLLFTMVHWHGLTKLVMHSDLTLEILDQQTSHLGKQFHDFKANNGVSQGTMAQGFRVGVNAKGKPEVNPEQSQAAPLPRQARKTKSFNFNTYKFHVLGDYVASIHRFGTMDSYSTEPQWQQKQSTNIESNKTMKNPQLHHHIGQTEKFYDEFGHYLCSHAGDPAIKDFLPWLRDHILAHVGTPASFIEMTLHPD
ncbi:hypothetical protein BDR06DRAFT_973805 [Suillus hirtellus]|nr:hypothetical protein BDR06DRAFT_973805 [Suillus hirtellus]